MKLYFARHGQTNANVNGLPDVELGDSINAVGVKEAKELAETLKNIHFDAIIASPLKRAIETAEAINEYHRLPIRIIDNLREREAATYVGAELWGKMFDFDNDEVIENVEQLPAFFDRIYPVLDDLKQEYKDKTILVVSHGGVHHAVHAYANQLPRKGSVRIDRLHNCDYRIYDIA